MNKKVGEEFKVGDVVRIKKSYGIFKSRNIGVVKLLYSDKSHKVATADESDYSYIHESYLEKISNEEVVKIPLRNYGDYSVKRTSKTVKFGCGAVKVSREDLRLAADVLDKGYKAKKDRLTTLIGKLEDFEATSAELTELRRLYNSVQSGGEVFNRLSKQASGYRSLSQLLEIPAITYRRIAG